MAVTKASDGEPAEELVPVGVKLGSTRTVIVYPDGDERVAVESMTCLTTYRDVLVDEQRRLYGEDAATEYPDESQFMIRNGLPVDAESTDLASTFFSELLAGNGIPRNSAVVYAIPAIDNEAGLRHFERVVEESPIGRGPVRSYPESLCGALPVFEERLDAIDEVFATVNLGGTIFEACAYRYGEQLAQWSTSSITGNRVDRRIANYVEAETQGRVNIDATTAREYKEGHADFESYEPFTDVVQQPGGGSHEFTVECSVMDAVDEYVDQAVEAITTGFLVDLERAYPDIYDRALDRPIVLTGGMACIPGLANVFATRLGQALQHDITLTHAERPDLAAAQGAYEIAARLIEVE
ncbi:rod shape-determining protein [Natronomonas salina]|uniref:rod shape-determining protein n=1 Tax=Natronomonas salina TaxID=1710540 RepID=UPI0015B7782E|nr:rod shape-determining protein [Natronomonas salina]QLD87613.1 rod shape-determining protein [Natronomonas salina]